MSHVLAVFTSEPADHIIAQGGTGHWVTNPERAARYRYVVCVRNRRHPSSPEDVAHRAAFLIGRIAGVEETEKTDRGQARVFVRISEYALIDVPEAWGKAQNPVWYTQTEDLGIDPAALTFKTIPEAASATSSTSPARPQEREDRRSRFAWGPDDLVPVNSDSPEASSMPSTPPATPEGVRPLTIQQAKDGVAAMFGVSPDSVRIIVEG